MAEFNWPFWPSGTPQSRGIACLPGREQHEFARRIDAIVCLLADKASGFGIESKRGGELGRIGPACFADFDFRNGQGLRVACFGFVKSLLPGRWPVLLDRVEGNLADTDAIILENRKAPLFLCPMVLGLGAPAHQRFLVAPDRKRQELSLVLRGSEPLDGDEAIDRLESRPKLCGKRQIIVPSFFLRLDLENHRKHELLLAPSSICRAPAIPRPRQAMLMLKTHAFGLGERYLTLKRCQENPCKLRPAGRRRSLPAEW